MEEVYRQKAQDAAERATEYLLAGNIAAAREATYLKRDYLALAEGRQPTAFRDMPHVGFGYDA